MIFIFLLFSWFGVHGAGFGGVAYLLAIYALDRWSVRRSQARWDALPGGYNAPAL